MSFSIEGGYSRVNVIYLILTSFRANLILRIFGSRISRVLIFAIAKKKKKKKKIERKRTKFRVFFLFS